MASIDISQIIETTAPAVPQIYAYTTPEIARHNGWTKIGYTEQDVRERIKQQTHTADVQWHLEWSGNATWEHRAGTFHDTDFHAYLEKQGVEREPKKEWFKISGEESHQQFYRFRDTDGVLDAPGAASYTLRAEQQRAVEQTGAFARAHWDEGGAHGGEFLWNAKPRFGKTLTAYDLCRDIGAQKVLIVTNRPAIANSWYDDYVKFVGVEGGYRFISGVDALAGKPYCLNREEYLRAIRNDSEGPKGFIEFVSLQDLKGSIRFGGIYQKLDEVADLTWDVLIIDEAHEGVDTFKTDVAFDHIKRRFTLHLSGTPFKAIANEKFADDAIYNWTYADEQQAKRDWPADSEQPNPYANLPKLNLLTYQMSDIVEQEARGGMEIDGEQTEFAFDLNEFFSTKQNGGFVHDADVDKFLDALTTQEKFPFSTLGLRDELRHTFWMLNRVDSAHALAKKLKTHPIFGDYEVVLAAGDGKIDADDENEKSLDKVRRAIKDHDKTITLSVGQLTTGVTVPEWTAVLMLSNMASPALYMQAAFRSQNPCLFDLGGGNYARKENAYVFDFDPARTLTIFEQFANDLYGETARGGGDVETRERHIRQLLNFFPVYGEDDEGQMVELDAEQVLSVPRRIHAREVVRRGFMSNFLFQNIASVFRAPAEVVEIIQRFDPYEQGKAQNAEKNKVEIDEGTADELSINDEGEVEIGGLDVYSDGKELRRRIGYVPDFFGVYDNLKVSEYMEFFASCYGITGLQARTRCHTLLEQVRLEDKEDFFVDGLSRGMKQRLCLARALIHDPDLLILDEPASGLDPRTRVEYTAILKELRDQGKTLLVSSHILSELSELCTSIGIIEQGRTVLQGSMDQIFARINSSNPLLISIFSQKEKALAILKSHPCVQTIAVQGDEIKLGFLGDRQDEALLLQQLIDADVMVSSFMREKGSLESLFMQITEHEEERAVLKHEMESGI